MTMNFNQIKKHIKRILHFPVAVLIGIAALGAMGFSALVENLKNRRD